MKTARLLLLCLTFGVLINEPIISVVNRPVLIGGIPVLYLYVFSVWAAMIGALAWLVHRNRS